jgi:ABC-type multidrug transport system fused ATPase/permease subunit
LTQALTLPFRLLRREPRHVAGFAAASIGRAALTSFSILLIYRFLGAVLAKREGQSLWLIVGLLLLAQLGAAALAYGSRLSEQRLVTAVELGTMDRLIRHILGLSAGFFDGHTHGDLVQSVRQDVANLRLVTVAATQLLLEGAQAVALIGVAVRLSPSLAVWAFLLIPVAAVPIAIFARRTLARSFGVRRKSVVIFDMLLQLLHGIRIIKIYGAEEAEARRTSDRASHYFDEVIGMERVRALARVALDSMAGINIAAVVVAGGFQVMSGTLGWPELLAFLLAARAVQGPLNNMNTAWLEIQRHGASVANIEALLRQVPDVRDRPGARPLPEAPRTIAVRDLGLVIDGSTILEHVSFEIRAGETLAIVGPSGGGKTTLLNLLARFYDPTSGAVLYDGTDLRDLRLDDVHAKMALVAQDPFLFQTSIADNIRRGRPAATDAEVEAAARAAEIHDDVMAMPDGYETVVGHGARPLSRGEAQRVNIARAFLKNAPILLLDEATSSLDPYAEARVQRAVDRLVAGRLAISVAHRLATVRDASRILVVEGGRVVGQGRHAGLLAGCATYQRLWNAQAHLQHEYQDFA